MTKLDRYILTLFLRTAFVCYCSIAGIFVVFHAFTRMDDLLQQGQAEGSLLRVFVRYYGPYMLLLFDWTAAIISLMALLFTVGWLRRSGELTAMLSAGVSHGRILRSMIVASALIVLLQFCNREFVMPGFREAITMKANDVSRNTEQSILAKYDRANRILIDGKTLYVQRRLIDEPSFRIDGDLAGFGDLLSADTATWREASANHPCGYLLTGVKSPERIDQMASATVHERPVLLTSRDHDWLSSRQCFVATTIDTGLLQSNQTATRYASIVELVGYVRNPAVYSSLSLHVLLHERVIRSPLDFALILLVLPLVVNRRDRNLFVLIGIAMGTVLFFFAAKSFANALGSGGYLLTPAFAAWIPLVVLGPLAYMRFREVQTV